MSETQRHSPRVNKRIPVPMSRHTREEHRAYQKKAWAMSKACLSVGIKNSEGIPALVEALQVAHHFFRSGMVDGPPHLKEQIAAALAKAGIKV